MVSHSMDVYTHHRRGSLTNDRAVLVSEEFYRQISEIRARDFAVKPYDISLARSLDISPIS
mgnify:CR=1 FL=1